MSQPKRYKFFKHIDYKLMEIDARMVEWSDGNWVDYSDYAALAAENERLKAIIVDECYGSDAYRKHENEAKRLTAENERLRKAGDAMADTRNKPTTLSEFGHLAMAWDEAKNGGSK